MIGIGCLVVIILVTACAGIRSVAVPADVTAGTCDGGMGARQGIIIVVVREEGRFPAGVRGMAVGAGGRNTGGGMIRIGGLIVCIDVAIGTVGGCPCISAGMAAVATRGGMGTGQGEIVVMIRESRRFPTGIRGMTGCTCGRNADRAVVRICRLVICRHMAVGTAGGRTGITAHMAVAAGRGDMSARQRENGGVVVETPFCITGRMTLQTGNAGIRITSHAFMLLIGIRLVVIVTVDT